MSLPQKPCAQCATSIDRRKKNGLCVPCSRKPCGDCGKITSPKNRSGYCSPCNVVRNNADPAFTARRQEAMARKWADPGFQEKMRLHGRLLGIRSAADETLRAKRRETGKWLYKTYLSRPDVVEKNRAAVRRSGPAQSAAKLAWCPPEYRAHYLYLMRNKKLLAVDARAAILGQVKADIAALSPFERQMRALERGGKLVANDARPASNQVVRRVG